MSDSVGNMDDQAAFSLPNFGSDSNRSPNDPDGVLANRNGSMPRTDSNVFSQRMILDKFYSMRNQMSLEERILAGDFKANR